jgi:hypothetical protein
LTDITIPTYARVGILGYTGCGKTILADWLARQWLPTAGAVLISDPKHDPQGSVWEGWGVTVQSGPEACDAWLDGERIIRLADTYDEQDTLALMEIAAAAPRSRLILDESAHFLPSDMRYAPEAFKRITNQGRVQRQGVICLGQQYAQLPAAFRLQSFVFASNMGEGTGRAWLKERTGRVETVPKYHWLLSSPDGATMEVDPVDLCEPLRVEALEQPLEKGEGSQWPSVA